MRNISLLSKILAATLCVAVVIIGVLSITIARDEDGAAGDYGVSAADISQEPPVVDLLGLKQRSLIIDSIVAYFDSISRNDPARTYYMSCNFMRESYDKDRQRGLQETVASMSEERGRAYVAVPSSISIPTDTTANVETAVIYAKGATKTAKGGTVSALQVILQKEENNWKVCSVTDE
ncbi:hypothetical protein [Gordonia malaquae]|uniref:hypothetical protein n=1 Tax=Gordonia malaquae TaxID=410332 RepID=UPI0030FEA9DE